MESGRDETILRAAQEEGIDAETVHEWLQRERIDGTVLGVRPVGLRLGPARRYVRSMDRARKESARDQPVSM